MAFWASAGYPTEWRLYTRKLHIHLRSFHVFDPLALQLASNDLAICVKLQPNLRQVTWSSASSYTMICIKLPYDLIEIIRWLDIYCSTDYLSLYDGNGGYVVRWVPCWAIPTFVPIDDNGCCVVRWVPCWAIPTFIPMDDNGGYDVRWGVFHVATA